MDGIACFNTPQCYTYTNIEWSFGSDAFSMSLATWTAQGRSAMAFSAGLHIFSSFLFNAFFLSGSLLVRKLLVRLLASKLDWIEGWIDFIAGWVPMASLTFNFFYCFAHTTIAAYIVAGLPVKATGVLTFASTCIVIALALLILIALFLLFSAAFLALRFAREKLASKGQSQIQVLPHAAQSNSIHTV